MTSLNQYPFVLPLLTTAIPQITQNKHLPSHSFPSPSLSITSSPFLSTSVYYIPDGWYNAC